MRPQGAKEERSLYVADTNAIATAQTQIDAIKTVLESGLAVCDSDVSTWVVKEGDEYYVDGTGSQAIEEDFDDPVKAIEYFLETKERFARK